MPRVKSPQDFGAGILFIAVGVGALWLGRDYAVGSLTRMGPGYLPTALSWALTAIGAVIALRSLAFDGPRIEPAALRPQAFILAAIVVFALGIERLGLAPTVALVAVVAALASREVRGREMVALGLGLAALCVILFVYLLGQPFPVWAF
jgi:Tripartite tricarboxylate transporter TctB family